VIAEHEGSDELAESISRLNAAFLAKRPRKYRAAVADHPEVLAWIDGYEAALPASNFGRLTQRPHFNSLFLYGGFGTGKTHSALGIPAVLADRGIPANFSYVRAVDYLDDQMNAPFAEKAQLFERARDSRLLILDDLFAGGEHRRSASDLFKLLDARFSDERPTVVCCNLDGAELREAMGGRLLDRLREDAASVKMDSASRRQFRPVG
jgi:DNA replication protein DnaC